MTDTNKNRFGKRIFSIVMVTILFALLASVAYADTTIALTSSNISEWPTVSYIDGEAMFFGQKISDAVVLTGGTVVYDGNVVEGHFEFLDPDLIPTLTGTQRADITFIPADETAYSGFEAKRCRNVTWKVSVCTPSFVDEVNDPLVATEVEPGALLSTSILSGGAMMNPYNPDETKIKSGTWNWAPSVNAPYSTIVNESGYYTASFVVNSYETVYVQVYVKVASAIPETSIAEYPVIPELLYDPNVTWADIELTGGKAVVKGTETEVAGKFAIKDTRLSVTPNTYFTEIEIVFTPDDPEVALPYEFRIPVTVNPCPISFGSDKKGISIDDPYIFEVAPFADMGEVRDILKNYHLNWPGSTGVQIEDYNGTAEHGRIYEYYVREYSNSNYTGNIAYVKLVFATTEITPSIVRAGSNKFKVDCAGHSVPGTFTIYHNDVEIATVSRKDGYVFDCEVYTDEGGTSHIKAVYNPVENDYYVCNDAETTITVAPMHTITNAKGTSSHPINIKVNGSGDDSGRTGSTVEMRATLDSFVCWIIKDADGKEVTLDGVDVNSKSITFLMPDYDLVVTYKTQADLDREEAIANCDHLCHSDNEFIQLFWNILNMFFRLLNVQQYCDCGELHYSAPLFPIA